MFRQVSPESAGIGSVQVSGFISFLEKHGCYMHDVILMRDDAIFFEAYWAPFDASTCHRQYSQTKSYVSMAIGLLVQAGKIRLDDRVADYFRDKTDKVLHPYLANQTVRDMLTMQTSVTGHNWFTHEDRDRVHLYLNHCWVIKPAGTGWCYDSTGSQVLCALVERVSGMHMLDFLKQNVFNAMGCFGTARILSVPTGENWGDSALICTPRDMASFGYLLMHEGNWFGQQLLPRDYVREATAIQTWNDEAALADPLHNGYGYQIWRMPENGFAFVGMGDQLTYVYPDKKLIFVCNADHQGSHEFRMLITCALQDMILDKLSDTPLPENSDDCEALRRQCSALKLRAVEGKSRVPMADAVQGKTYLCEQNGCGIESFRLEFNRDFTEGVLYYKNAHGDKELPFGLGQNCLTRFPQDGYSDTVGGEPGHRRYVCASSAAWQTDTQLTVRVLIIDDYLGNMSWAFSFKGDDASLRVRSVAENFLKEYDGWIIGHAAR